MRKGAALFAVFLIALLAACGSGDSDDDPQLDLLADRILRLGEDLETAVEVNVRAVPSGLSGALNPGATAETPDEDLVKLTVHPEGVLIGSFSIERPDGVLDLWLVYDVPADDRSVERKLLQQLDATPWQVVAGQSNENQSVVRFQSTMSGDIEGTAVIRSVTTSADDPPLTSVVYILEVQPIDVPSEQDFVLPDARPVPEDFPAAFLLLDGMTPITVFWGSSAAGDSYQMLLLTEQSAFDVAAEYRERLDAEGWELLDDRAVGFATVLEFQSGDGGTQASLTTDAFSEDESYTSVVLELRTSPQSAGN